MNSESITGARDLDRAASVRGERAAGSVAGWGAALRVVGYLERSDGATRRKLSRDLALPAPTVVSAVAKLMDAGLVEEYALADRPVRTGRPAVGVRLAGVRPVLGFLGWDSGSLTVSVVSYAGELIASADFGIGMRPDGVQALEPALAYLDAVGSVGSVGSVGTAGTVGSVGSVGTAGTVGSVGSVGSVGTAGTAGTAGTVAAGSAADDAGGHGAARPRGPRAASGRADRLTAVVLGAPAPFQSGVGIPASRFVPAEATQPTGPVLPFVSWLRTDPAPELARRLRVPVIVENNANLAALGEYTAGGAGDLIFVRFVERGVGGGLVLGGALLRGASGFGGELGHIHVDDNGPLCACGGRGCLNSLLGQAMVDTVQPLYAEPLTMHDVVEFARAGEPGPSRVLTDLGRTVGRRLADLCTVLNPSAVVVGGQIGAATDLVARGIREQIDRYASPIAGAAVQVRVSTLGSSAEILGAIELSRLDSAAAAGAAR